MTCVSAILKMAENAQERQRMGLEGRRRFADQFRHETMTAQLRSLYLRLLSGGTAASGDLGRSS